MSKRNPSTPNAGQIPSRGRRKLLRDAAAAAVAGTAAAGAAGTAGAEPGEAVAPDEIAAALKLAGRSYSAAEREMMARSLSAAREQLVAARARTLPETLAPALCFRPLLPGPAPEVRREYRLASGGAPPFQGSVESLAYATVPELARLLKARRVTSTALTRMYLDRLKRYGPRLHCVVTLTEDLALRQAARADEEIAAGHWRGPLHGIPWGAKDLLATKGIPTTWGARPFERQVFDYDATVVRRLEEAGAVLVAKLSMGELAMGDVWFGGRTRTPWDLERGSGGSSAGSGAATAAGLVGFAIGTETLGSIVNPSVVNGVTGLRPTYGRVPRTGAMALCWSLDKLGPMARGVEDCALVLQAIYGPDGRDDTAEDLPFEWRPNAPLARIRVGIDAAAFEQSGKNEKTGPVYARVIETLEGLGFDLRPVPLPGETQLYSHLAFRTIEIEAAASFSALVESGGLAQLVQQGPGNWPNLMRVGTTIPAADYLHAQRLRRRLQQEMAEAMREIDVYVTVPFTGPTIYLTNLTGHPSLVTRCGMAEGRPVQVEFIGGLYREAELLRVGLAYERARGARAEWPALDPRSP